MVHVVEIYEDGVDFPVVGELVPGETVVDALRNASGMVVDLMGDGWRGLAVLTTEDGGTVAMGRDWFRSWY